MKDLEYYVDQPYSVAVTHELCTDGSACYMARVAELPGCESHGDTPEQALYHLDEAKRLFIKSMLEDGIVSDPPGSQWGVNTVWRMMPSVPVNSASDRSSWTTLPSDVRTPTVPLTV